MSVILTSWPVRWSIVSISVFCSSSWVRCLMLNSAWLVCFILNWYVCVFFVFQFPDLLLFMILCLVSQESEACEQKNAWCIKYDYLHGFPGVYIKLYNSSFLYKKSKLGLMVKSPICSLLIFLKIDHVERKVRITQNKGNESENSYQKLKRS